MPTNDADIRANSVDPDQTASLELITINTLACLYSISIEKRNILSKSQQIKAKRIVGQEQKQQTVDSRRAFVS